jgi:hypothetical protein
MRFLKLQNRVLKEIKKVIKAVFIQRIKQLLKDISDFNVRISIFEQENQQLKIEKELDDRQISDLKVENLSIQRLC